MGAARGGCQNWGSAGQGVGAAQQLATALCPFQLSSGYKTAPAHIHYLGCKLELPRWKNKKDLDE